MLIPVNALAAATNSLVSNAIGAGEHRTRDAPDKQRNRAFLFPDHYAAGTEMHRNRPFPTEHCAFGTPAAGWPLIR